MNIMELNFSEIIRTILTMTLTGSVVALLLFIIKPIIKNRLPKSFQYYMWFAVFIALILPLSKIIMLPEPSMPNNPATSFTPIYDIVQWISDTAMEEPVRLVSLSQRKNEQNTLQIQSQFLNVAIIFFIVWVFGILAFGGANIISYMLFIGSLKKYNICASPHKIELLNKLSGKRRTPRLYLNSTVPTPILIGVFRPAIVLPDKKYTDTQLQNILLHELTHLRRYDIAIKWLSVFLEVLHWYNPMIYFVRREISRACELACDEAVIKNLDIDGKQSYGDTLIAVVADKTAKISLLTTMCEDKKNLIERLDAIMKHTNFSKRTIVFSSVFFVIILCGTFYLGAAGSTNNTQSESSAAYAALTPLEKQKHDKELELKKVIHNFDKKNIIETWVFLGDSDNEITYASIFIVTQEEITDSSKKEALISLAAESLNLNVENIYIDYMDVETFTSL